MNWCREMFGVEKPIIALLHLNAFPGDPLFRQGDSMEKTVEEARKDLHALQDGGVDGILFSNEFSLPYQTKVDMIGPCAMARVIGELKSEISVPFGVDCESDVLASIELAAAVSANFVRGLFTGVYAGDCGIIVPDIATVLRRKKALGLDDCKLLYFINNEADEYIVKRELTAIARSTIFSCKPDAFLLMGFHAGQEPESNVIGQIRKVTNGVPVFTGTGCRTDNIIEKLKTSDGATVGTTFKEEGKFENHVDLLRVKAFMEQVKKYRREYEK
ncbi:MAG: BtpA/SgcQ family protein [Clostridiales bacterium]|nr:BtpA/SgcQ family protein [Clostridiales bacterium]